MNPTPILAVLAAAVAVAIAPPHVLARNRTYNPAIGRFMQRDPAAPAGGAPIVRNLSDSQFTMPDTDAHIEGMNPYAYARSNPNNLYRPPRFVVGNSS